MPEEMLDPSGPRGAGLGGVAARLEGMLDDRLRGLPTGKNTNKSWRRKNGLLDKVFHIQFLTMLFPKQLILIVPVCFVLMLILYHAALKQSSAAWPGTKNNRTIKTKHVGCESLYNLSDSHNPSVPIFWSPDPPAQIQVPCHTLFLLPKGTEAHFLHTWSQTRTKHYPAAPALLGMTLQTGKRGLKQNQALVPCCVCWDLTKPPGQEEGLEVWVVEGSWGWEIVFPQEQKVLDEI